MNEGSPGNDSKGVFSQPRGILRVLEVLTACAMHRDGITLAALSRELKLPKTTLHRILRTLEGEGYLSELGGYYSIGPASASMGKLLSAQKPNATLTELARPVLEWLARETNESAMLGTLADQRDSIIFTDAIDSTAPLRFTLPIGDRRGLHYGSAGKAALAFFPEAERDAYIENAEFVQLTPYTTRPADISKVLAKARAAGVVYDRDGNFEGASAMSSPIFGPGGSVLGAVAIAGPTYRMDANREPFENLIRAAAKRISRAAGYMDDYPPTG